MRSCRADGWLLQPEKPPTAIDAMYDGRVAPAGGLAAAGYAQVWTTYSNLSLGDGSSGVSGASDEARGGAASAAAEQEAAAGGAGGTESMSLLTWLIMSIDVEAPFLLDGQRDLYPAMGAEQAVVWRRWHDAVSKTHLFCTILY
jgi:hypothetical protein